MVKKKEISILVIGAVILVAAYFYLDTSDTLFGVIIDQFSPIDWDKVHPKYIVKNSLPIELLETNNSSCTVKAENFEMITNHEYFVRNHEITEKLQYDAQEKTIVVPCDKLQGEKSRLNVWYIIEEDPYHPTEWKYFITEWTSDAVAP